LTRQNAEKLSTSAFSRHPVYASACSEFFYCARLWPEYGDWRTLRIRHADFGGMRGRNGEFCVAGGPATMTASTYRLTALAVDFGPQSGRHGLCASLIGSNSCRHGMSFFTTDFVVYAESFAAISIFCASADNLFNRPVPTNANSRLLFSVKIVSHQHNCSYTSVMGRSVQVRGKGGGGLRICKVRVASGCPDI